jgi:hypothetical protein
VINYGHHSEGKETATYEVLVCNKKAEIPTAATPVSCETYKDSIDILKSNLNKALMDNVELLKENSKHLKTIANLQAKIESDDGELKSCKESLSNRW